MTTTLTIDRTSLDLEPLVIYGSRAAATSGLWLPAEGLGEPSFQPRYAYAPDSRHIDGRVLLGVSRDQSTLPLVVRAAASSAAALDALQVELEAALAQFVYDLTRVRDGVTTVFQAVYSVPQPADVEPWMRANHEARFSVVIPVNPT